MGLNWFLNSLSSTFVVMLFFKIQVDCKFAIFIVICPHVLARTTFAFIILMLSYILIVFA